MATTLYLTNLVVGIPTYNQLARPLRGNGVVSTTGNTTAGGTWISLDWFSTPPLEPFSFSGTTSFNLRGLENNAQANASLGARFYRWNPGSGLSASLFQLSSATELGTAEAARTATGTPTAANFASGDILVIEIGIVNVGTMGGGRTVTFFYDGPTAAASGDSYVTLNPNLVFKNNVRNVT